MNRCVRLALTWLLLVALPLQGYAAGGMLFCGANGAVAIQAVDLADAHHALGGDGGRHHHAAVTAQGAEDGSSPQSLVHGKCSVCSACCSGAALLSSAEASRIDALRNPPALMQDRAGPSCAAARLDRPPRLPLA